MTNSLFNAAAGGTLPGVASAAGGSGGNYIAATPQDRLVRKEVALGQIRDVAPPEDHIGLSLIAPWLEVDTDEVVFDYVTVETSGLAPARAEDAESELARKDDTIAGQGRASVIDWAIKDHYTASDVNRYRELRQAADQIQAGLPASIDAQREQLAKKIARDDLSRRKKLDNRIEWLITQGLSAGSITYNDGRIQFGVDYGRPVGQSAQAPASGTYASDTHDPINDMIAADQYMYETQGVHLDRAIVSKKFLLRAARASKFGLKAGFVGDGSGGLVSPDPRYLINGYGPQYAIDLLKEQTGIEFIVYDSVYRTRALGSNTIVNTRFIPENRVIFLPSEEQLSQFDDTEIGFAKTLTSPHPEGNWEPGFYEWERDKVDPWGTDRGNGVKAFPVFLHLDKTLTWDVTL